MTGAIGTEANRNGAGQSLQGRGGGLGINPAAPLGTVQLAAILRDRGRRRI